MNHGVAYTESTPWKHVPDNRGDNDQRKHFFRRFSKRYELPLLVQSVVMNITMFLMIHLCVKVKRNNNIMRARERVFSGETLGILNPTLL